MNLVVGLGNNQPDLLNSRHNLGFMSVNNIVRKLPNFTTNINDELRCALYKDDYNDVLYMQPFTGMNSSGEAVKLVLDRYRININNILVIYDDYNLPFGKLRLRAKGGHGRHNGLKSIIENIGTQEFSRLRVGLGKPDTDITINYVLGDFTAEERCQLPQILDKVGIAVNYWLTLSIDDAMTKVNGDN